MRIGIANPFAYRPHVGHMVFIYRQFERLGYQTFVLRCGGALDNCNSKVNKVSIARKLECVKCRVGGIQSYLNIDRSRIDLKIPVSQDAIKLGKEEKSKEKTFKKEIKKKEYKKKEEINKEKSFKEKKI